MKDCIAVRVKLTDAHITLPRKQRKTANALYFLFKKRKVMLQCLVRCVVLLKLILKKIVQFAISGDPSRLKMPLILQLLNSRLRLFEDWGMLSSG